MLIYRHFGLTRTQVKYMEACGFRCAFKAMGCVDKDFYDIYYEGYLWVR